MRWRARVIAPLVAAVLGIGGGVAAAFVVPDDDQERASTVNDPLHLDIPLVSLNCTGDALLVVGYGDNVAPLGNAVQDNGGSVRYLRTDESCPTIMGPEGAETPDYVVYRGPYKTLSEPCAIRMTPEHRGDFVTVLKQGNTMLVKCPCTLPTDAAPDLAPGMVSSAEDVVWVRALQGMLNDDDPVAFPHDRITGAYDPFTAARVTAYQADAPGLVYRAGFVDEETWRVLTDRLCRNYDY